MVVVLALLASADAAPLQLNHSGRVMDTTGLPVDGSFDLTVSLYADQTAVTPLWTETSLTAFDNGYFSVRLGTDSLNALDLGDFASDSVWVTVAVDGGAELPRMPIASVPYALWAEDVAGTTLSDLSCSPDDVATFDGTDWTCAAVTGSGIVDWTDIQNIPADLQDGTDDDTLAGLPCFDAQIPRYNGTAGAWTCSDVLEAEVDAAVANNGYALDADIAQVGKSGDYGDLTGAPSFAAVATSGDYGDLTGAPSFAAVATSGDYGDLSGTPSLALVATSGAYSDLSGTPTFAPVATSGDYNDLINTPSLAAVATSGAWGDVGSKPAGFADDVDDDALGALSCSDGDRIRQVAGSWVCEPAPVLASGTAVSGTPVDLSPFGFTAAPTIVTNAPNHLTDASSVTATSFTPVANAQLGDQRLWAITQGQVYRYNTDGTIDVQFADPPSGNFSGVTVDDTTGNIWVLRQSPGGEIVEMNVAGGIVTTNPTTSDIDDMITYDHTDDTFWASGCSQFVAHLNKNGSEITRFTVPGTTGSSCVRGISVDPFDGSLWIVDESGSNRIIHTDRSGTTIDGPYDISGLTSNSIVGVVRLTDGTFWVTDQNPDLMHQLNASLTSVLTTVPTTGNNNPLGLDVEADGTPVTGVNVDWIAVGQ